MISVPATLRRKISDVTDPDVLSSCLAALGVVLLGNWVTLGVGGATAIGGIAETLSATSSCFPTNPVPFGDAIGAVTLGGEILRLDFGLACLGVGGGDAVLTFTIFPVTDLTDGSRWISASRTAGTVVGVMGLTFAGGGVSSESDDVSDSALRGRVSTGGLRFATGLRVAASSGKGGIRPLLEF